MIWLGIALLYLAVGAVLSLSVFMISGATQGISDEACKVALAVWLLWGPFLVLGLCFGLWISASWLLTYLLEGQRGPGG